MPGYCPYHYTSTYLLQLARPQSKETELITIEMNLANERLRASRLSS